MNIKGMVVGLLLVGLFVGVFGLFFAQMSENYSQDYNTTEHEIYLQSAALQEQIVDINDTINNANPESSDQTGFVTAFLGSGWSVLKTTFQSFSIMNTVGDAAIKNAQLGEGTGLFKAYVLGIAAVIFLFTIISVLVGRDV